MMDRFRACSPLVALAIASVCALSACEQDKPQESVAKVSGALTSLQAGDLAVTCLTTTGANTIQITPLVAIQAGSDLKYTDQEATTAGVFQTNNERGNVDIGATITTAVTAGASFTFTTTGLGTPQESVFLYQGTIDEPNPDAGVDAGADAGTGSGTFTGTLIWGIQITDATPAVWSDPPTADISALPTSLSTTPNSKDNVVIPSGTSKNFAYNVLKGTSGTKAQLQALITNPLNWIAGTTAAPVTCPTSFTVLPDGVDSGAGNDSSVDSSTGAGGSDGGAGGVIGTTDSGAGGSTDSGATPDAPLDVAADTGGGNGGTIGTDAAVDTGVGGAAGTADSGTTVDAKADTGGTADAKADTGSTVDAKADTGSTVDAKPDTGSTGGTDAKTTVDAGKDSGTAVKSSSSGCGCSTASNSQNLSASVSLLALAGIVMTARRRRRR